MKRNGRLLLFTVLLIAVTTACKVLFAAKLEWSGFSPIIAIALFSGMIVKDKNRSFLLPLLALLISDAIIECLYLAGKFPFRGFYSYQWLNYTLLLMSTLIGWIVKGKNHTRIFTGAIAAPTVFFLLSNFNVWAGHGGHHHPMTFDGLLACYGDGLPFYKHALAATLLFVPALLFAYNVIVEGKQRLTIA